MPRTSTGRKGGMRKQLAVKAKSKTNPWVRATRDSDLELICALIKKKSDVNEQMGLVRLTYSWCCMHALISYSFAFCLLALQHQATPLMIAIEEEHKEGVLALINAKTDVNIHDSVCATHARFIVLLYVLFAITCFHYSSEEHPY